MYLINLKIIKREILTYEPHISKMYQIATKESMCNNKQSKLKIEKEKKERTKI